MSNTGWYQYKLDNTKVKGSTISYEKYPLADHDRMIADAEEADRQGFMVEFSDEPELVIMRISEKDEPWVRGEKRYGAAKPEAEAQGYYGFGGHVVARYQKYHVYCIGSTDAQWQASRLASGMNSLANAVFTSCDAVIDYMRQTHRIEPIEVAEGPEVLS